MINNLNCCSNRMYVCPADPVRVKYEVGKRISTTCVRLYMLYVFIEFSCSMFTYSIEQIDIIVLRNDAHKNVFVRSLQYLDRHVRFILTLLSTLFLDVSHTLFHSLSLFLFLLASVIAKHTGK